MTTNSKMYLGVFTLAPVIDGDEKFLGQYEMLRLTCSRVDC